MLKPGCYFASYEWVSTKKYDPKNRDHVRVMDEINYGNGLPVCNVNLTNRHAQMYSSPCGVVLYMSANAANALSSFTCCCKTDL